MSGTNLPGMGQRIQLQVGAHAHACRVEGATGPRLTIAAPLTARVEDVPDIGTPVKLGWTDQRGRHRVEGRVAAHRGGAHPAWDVDVTGPVSVVQDRLYVRGGGGEPLKLRRIDPPGPALNAFAVDVAERGVRGRFDYADVVPGDPVTVEFHLGDEVIGVIGRVLRVIDQPRLRATDVVVVFEPSEAQATAIRRYVLAAQLRARNLAS